jgi:hypothetical protein
MDSLQAFSTDLVRRVQLLMRKKNAKEKCCFCLARQEHERNQAQAWSSLLNRCCVFFSEVYVEHVYFFKCLRRVYAEFTQSLRRVYLFAQVVAVCAEIKCLRRVYAVFTQCLRSVYAVFAQCLRNVYAVFTQWLRSVYAVFTRCLRSDYAMFTQCLLEYLTVCAVFAQLYVYACLRMFTQRLRNVYAMFTQCLRRSVFACTMRSTA